MSVLNKGFECVCVCSGLTEMGLGGLYIDHVTIIDRIVHFRVSTL